MKTPKLISVEISKEDVKEGIGFLSKESRASKVSVYFTFSALAILAVSEYFKLQKEDGMMVAIIVSIALFLIAGLIAFLLAKILMYFSIKAVVPKDQGAGIIGTHEYLIEESCITERTEVSESKFTWGSVPHIKRTKKCIYLYQTELSAHMFPLKAFKSIEEFDSFYELLLSLKVKAQPVVMSNG